jgi:hypothetical protein
MRPRGCSQGINKKSPHGNKYILWLGYETVFQVNLLNKKINFFFCMIEMQEFERHYLTAKELLASNPLPFIASGCILSILNTRRHIKGTKDFGFQKLSHQGLTAKHLNWVFAYRMITLCATSISLTSIGVYSVVKLLNIGALSGSFLKIKEDDREDLAGQEFMKEFLDGFDIDWRETEYHSVIGEAVRKELGPFVKSSNA